MTDAPPGEWDAIGGFRFGDSEAMADQLLDLVLAGRKTATCWAAREGRKVAVGWRLIVRDGRDVDQALIRITGLERRRFGDVDAAFARDEGEADGTPESWRQLHQAYFERNGGFDAKMDVWCCRFALLDVR